MYEWFLPQIEHTKQILQDFSLNLEFILNPPAAAEITACEVALGIQIPQSYREFLLQWNGAYLFREASGELPGGPLLSSSCDIDTAIFLQGTRTIVDLNEQGHFENTQSSLLIFADVGLESDFCGFDMRQTTGSDYAIVDCGACFSLEECLKRRISNSFAEWLKKIFDQVIVEKKDPIFWFDMPQGLDKVREQYKELNLAREYSQQALSGADDQSIGAADEYSIIKLYKEATTTIQFPNNPPDTTAP